MNIFLPIKSKNLTVTAKNEKLPKRIIEEKKADTPEAKPHVIPELENTQKSDISM